MNTRNKRRTWSNLHLTRRFRFQYLGKWVMVSLVYVVLLDLLVYALYQQLWRNYAPVGADPAGEAALRQQHLLMVLVVLTVLFGAGISLLAAFTAHRIGGPYIALKRTLAALSAGELERRLHFREGDHLEDVEAAFNEAIDGLVKRIRRAEASKPELEPVRE